jgi:hypothetical protein
MRSNNAVALVVLAGCGGSHETSKAGPVGKVTDLRDRITKPDVAARAPKDDAATKQELPLDVHGVKAEVVWRTFEDNGTKYILSAGTTTTSPARTTVRCR